MRADRDTFMEQIRQLDRDALLCLAVSLYDELAQLRLLQLENERISTEAYIQFSELNGKYAAAVHENEKLKKLLAKEAEKNALKTKSIFGRKTESFLSLLDAKDHPVEEPVDESPAEDAGPSKKGGSRVIDLESHKGRRGAGDRHIKKNPSLADSLKELPQQILYDLDVEGLNGQYGENNWRIAYWHRHEQLMKLDTPYYTQVVYTPVVSVWKKQRRWSVPRVSS